MNEKKGLSSVNERLQKLESLRIDNTPDNDDQLSKLVFRLKNKEQENKKKTMTSTDGGRCALRDSASSGTKI